VRGEVMAKPGEPVHIVEYLKPGVDELAAMLPTGLANRLVRWTDKRGLTDKLNKGMYVKTTSVFGFALLRGLAAMRPLRRMTSRWQAEQALIDRWLGDVHSAAMRDLHLALEIALCGRLIKGYGETYKRGRVNFLRILDNLVSGTQFSTDRDRALAIKSAREAALADPEGRKLEGNLATHGVTPLPPQAKPIKFFRKKPGSEERRHA
jgi:indolepyruvate ferredoxin oxidoreductase, beta subunit